MKKFELTTDRIEENGTALCRIKALIDFVDVKAGDLGGYVEKEENLSQSGNSWVYGDAHVCGNACVRDNARVCDNACVRGNARVSGDACVYGNACVYDNAWVYGNARVYGNAEVSGDAWMYGSARVYGNAQVCGDAQVHVDAYVYGDALIFSNADYIYLKGFGSHNRSTTMFRTKGGNICVSCGCFSGTLQEFESKVKETHRNNKFAREYLALVEAAKIHFEL